MTRYANLFRWDIYFSELPSVAFIAEYDTITILIVVAFKNFLIVYVGEACVLAYCIFIYLIRITIIGMNMSIV